eukprot:m.107636 g.107636  ORF g.107636 m.107636 type:complete len:79 (+) comp37304_c0_seq22:1180-1416(+)
MVCTSNVLDHETGWNAHKVELALWTALTADQLGMSFLKDNPSEADSHPKLSQKKRKRHSDKEVSANKTKKATEMPAED